MLIRKNRLSAVGVKPANDSVSVPLKFTVPLTFIWSDIPAPVPLISAARVPSRLRLPVLIVPRPLPGAMMPPTSTITSPSVPEPVRVAPLFTVVALLEMLPFTASVPALTVVVPEYGLALPNVNVAEPDLINEPVPARVLVKVFTAPLP